MLTPNLFVYFLHTDVELYLPILDMTKIINKLRNKKA